MNKNLVITFLLFLSITGMALASEVKITDSIDIMTFLEKNPAAQ